MIIIARYRGGDALIVCENSKFASIVRWALSQLFFPFSSRYPNEEAAIYYYVMLLYLIITIILSGG